MVYSYLLIKVNPMTDKNIDLKLVKVGTVRKYMDAHFRDEISYTEAVNRINKEANKNMKAKLIDILENHYHGRNFIESRCADDILKLIKSLIPNDDVLDTLASADASKYYKYADDNIGWYAFHHGFTNAIDWIKDKLITNNKQ